MWGEMDIELFSYGDIHHPYDIDVQFVFQSESGIRHHLNQRVTLSFRIEYDHIEQYSIQSRDTRYLLGVGVKW
jgi:hypothetical protein